ncbi:MAG: hypothetical protein R2941_23580 [Desulfobacterales bacterium]
MIRAWIIPTRIWASEYVGIIREKYPSGNGVDDDGNGYIDDVHGYNFTNDTGDPFDDHGWNPLCSRTIAAVMNNGTGIAESIPQQNHILKFSQ